MLTRHLNKLLFCLEHVYDIGCVTIRKNELLIWYGQEKVTAKLWRDLAQKWEDLGYDTPLLIGDVEGEWVLIWGQGLRPTSDCWLKDVRELADTDVEADQVSEKAA